MNNQVKVIASSDAIDAPTYGVSRNNPLKGYVRVSQTKATFSNGFMNEDRRTALINADLASLKRKFTHQGQELEGKIVVKESVEPINEEDLEQGIKIAGKTNIPCTINGQVIYRRTFYTEDESEKDELLKHDNGDAIKAYQAKAKAESVDLGA